MIIKRTARKKPAVRKQEILSAACALALKRDYKLLTLIEIADVADVSHTLISYYFGTIANMRDEIMRHAVQNKIVPIILRGLLDKNPIALGAPTALKRRAVQMI